MIKVKWKGRNTILRAESREVVFYVWVCECVCALTEGATASQTCSVTVDVQVF